MERPLQQPIRELLYEMIRSSNLKENDAVSYRTFKIMLVSRVIEELDLTWAYLINLFKTHTPIHPEIAKELQKVGDEDLHNTIAQIFVRNEKLSRIIKGLTQQGHDMDALLAVDGLGGPHAPNFEHKYYVNNLKFGGKADSKSIFDNEPEYKRKHVQTIRELYTKLEKVPCPEKQIYQILRYTFHDMGCVKLPELEWDEKLDTLLQNECSQYYREVMGKENIENLLKTIKRTRAEKRTLEREDETPPEKR